MELIDVIFILYSLTNGTLNGIFLRIFEGEHVLESFCKVKDLLIGVGSVSHLLSRSHFLFSREISV
jgi:hypothetical protein